VPNCRICNGNPALCDECVEGFMKGNDKYCSSLDTIKSTLYLTNENNPTELVLDFETKFEDYFYRFNGKTDPIHTLIIYQHPSFMDPSQYKVTYRLLLKSNSIKINIKYKTTIYPGTVIYVNLDDIPGSRYKHANTNFSLILPPYTICEQGEIYNVGTLFSLVVVNFFA